MRDGGCYEGEFLNGEITGKGFRKWHDGSTYEGDFFEGEKHGQGKITYTNASKLKLS